MKPLALSTMYAQQERFENGIEFVRYAAAAGYQAIEISHSTRLEKLQQIFDCSELPISSIHQPAPYEKRPSGRGNSSANLASIDDDERRAALDFAKVSIEWALKAGAKKVVVHLGQVSDVHEQFEQELEMRQMFDSGRADEARFTELRAEAVERRAAEAEPYVDGAKKSLQELVRAAEPHGIAIGLENRYHYHEIPAPEEYEELLDGLANEQAGYWHDVGHAEVLHRLGFIDRHVWLDRWSSRCIGAHLHDVSGIGDHRAPGDGDVQWDYVVAGVQHLRAFTLEINQHQPDDKVREAVGFLRGIGLG